MVVTLSQFIRLRREGGGGSSFNCFVRVLLLSPFKKESILNRLLVSNPQGYFKEAISHTAEAAWQIETGLAREARRGVPFELV